jgi:PKD repeat protein
MKKLSLFFLLAFGFLFAGAQQSPFLPCGTTDYYNKVTLQNPELVKQRELLEEHTHRYEQHAHGESNPPVYIIPVVFHIIHQYGSENISNAQIYDQMRILNEDFRKLNSDISNIVSTFQGIAADSEIEFRLAKKDPNGNCHTGIDRIVSPETNIGDDGSKLNSWPRNKYLNVWVVKTIASGAAGYAYLPGGAPSGAVDGIMIRHDYIGSIGTGSPVRSRALTHEVGHFLNLSHTWGNTNQPGVACGNDGVNDTPITKGWTTCNLTSNDVCNPGTPENVQNFMEYSYCPCIMFTQGQKTRMRAALTSATAARNNLPTAANLTATGTDGSPQALCSPVSDFIANRTMICAGSNVTFTHLVWMGQASSYTWSFPGGTPSSSNDSIVTVTYNTPGVYSVTLTASNATGSNTKVRTNYIIVSSNTAMYNNPTYTEGFENITVPNTDWIINNPALNAWQTTSTVGYTGNYSLRFVNNANQKGEVDDAISPSLNPSLMNSPTFTFRVAYAQRTSTSNDRLRVLISTDCGQSWTQRYNKSGTVLKTVNPTTANFVPSGQSQWRLETVSITPFLSDQNMRFKFEFTSDGGNNIYIDDINIMGSTGISEPEENPFLLQVFPNPVYGNSEIAFVLDEKNTALLGVFNLVGEQVLLLENRLLGPGNYSYRISTENLASGTYMVRLSAGEKQSWKKIIIY